MAYYIFLKSLRSLEEFRKNPHVKIPPKSPSTIFQSLAIIKNQILFRKEFFLHFWPNRPSGQPAHPASQPSQPHPPPFLPQAARVLGPSRPTRPWRICQKPSLLRVCAARRRCLLPLSPPRGPRLLASSSPQHRLTPVKISPRRCPAPRMPPSFYSPPSSLSPLNPLQTERERALTPSMALKPITPVINSRPPLPGAPPAPIKGRGAPPAITAPHLALNRLLLSPQLLLTERPRLLVLHHHRPTSTVLPELR
jgi:hypothetical protein